MESLLNLTFSSLVEAQAACDNAARSQGFALAIATKKPNATEPSYVCLRCSKGRKYTSRGNEAIAKRRKTSTQMTECPFRLILKLNKIQQAWSITQSSTLSHNHLFTEPMAHTKYSRELLLRYQSQIISKYNSNIRPGVILTQLRGDKDQDPNLQGVTAQQIYNIIAEHRRKELAGRTPLQFLYDQLLNTSDYTVRDHRDEHNRLSSLFIAPQSGLQLLLQFYSIWQLDCTYKTNRFNMPLLNICGITYSRKTFSIASIFLPGEAEREYRWALTTLLTLLREQGIRLPRVIVTDRDLALINAIRSYHELEQAVQLLCRWHISKNILAKCKPYFPKAVRNPQTRQIERAPSFLAFLDEWELLINSTTLDTFEERLQAFQSASYPPITIRYALNTWLKPWKERFVRCFIDQHRHFGYTTTSAVEGLHSTMKRFLWSSTGDLTTVIRKFKVFWEHQAAEIAAIRLHDMHKTTTFTLQHIYLPIRERVSSRALKLVAEQHHMMKIHQGRLMKPSGGRVDSLSCSCAFYISMGLPCRHILFERLTDTPSLTPTPTPRPTLRPTLQLEDFDPFWHIQLPQDIASLAPFEPVVVRGKGRPRGAFNLESSRSTRREPSAYEIVESIERAEATEAAIASTNPLASIATAALSSISQGLWDQVEEAISEEETAQRQLEEAIYEEEDAIRRLEDIDRLEEV